VERISLNAEKRVTSTKGAIRQLRLGGKVPAILYGKKREPQMLSVDAKELSKTASTKAGLNVLVDLDVKGEGKTTVLIRDYQAHPIHRVFTHVDFQVIDVSEKIVVEVPIDLVGAAVGVKEGGILEQLMRKIEVRCLATQIPERIEVDVSELKIGDSIHSNQIKLAEGVEFLRTMIYTIVTVVPPTKEEVPVAAAAAPVEGAPAAEGAAAPAAAEGAAAPKAEGGEKAKGAAPKAEGAEKTKGAASKAEGAEKTKK